MEEKEMKEEQNKEVNTLHWRKEEVTTGETPHADLDVVLPEMV